MRATMMATAILAVMVANGCASMQEVRQQARTTQEATAQQAQQLFDNRPSRAAGASTGAIVTDAPYVDPRPILHNRYPSSFRRAVTINEPMGVPLAVLAQRVQAMLGVRVLYQAELSMATPASAAPQQSVRASLPMDATGDAGLPPLAGILPALSGQAAASRSAVPIIYSGDAVGLFNAIAGATGSSWEFEDASQTVQFYRVKTMTFRIPAVQGEGSTAATMGGQSQSSAAGGQPISSASAEGKFSTSGSVWKDLDATIKKMLSAEGDYVVSPVAGTITVRDRPDRMEQISKYLRDTAEAMARQVDVELTIYRVVTADNDVRALNWNGLFSAAAGKYGVQLNTMGSRPAVDGMSSLSVTIPSSNSKWGGSSIIMDALNTLGKTSVEQSTSIVTSNNQPAPFKVVRRTSYLQSLSQGVMASAGTQVATGPTLTPGVVETGLNMYVVPHVQDDGRRVKLRIMASISTLEKMNSIGTATNFIQIPETASREFQSEAWLNSGETLVLAGFQQVDSGQDTRSPLGKGLWFLGGSSQANNSREIVVIAIRPVVTSFRSRI